VQINGQSVLDGDLRGVFGTEDWDEQGINFDVKIGPGDLAILTTVMANDTLAFPGLEFGGNGALNALGHQTEGVAAEISGRTAVVGVATFIPKGSKSGDKEFVSLRGVFGIKLLSVSAGSDIDFGFFS